MTQVEYTKEAYQVAKKTPSEERTEEQQLLAQIDFRQGPNPILRLSSGASVIIRKGILIEGDADGNIGIVLQKVPETSNTPSDPNKDPREKDNKTGDGSGGTVEPADKTDPDIIKGGDSNFGYKAAESAAEMIAKVTAKKNGE